MHGPRCPTQSNPTHCHCHAAAPQRRSAAQLACLRYEVQAQTLHAASADPRTVGTPKAIVDQGSIPVPIPSLHFVARFPVVSRCCPAGPRQQFQGLTRARSPIRTLFYSPLRSPLLYFNQPVPPSPHLTPHTPYEASTLDTSTQRGPGSLLFLQTTTERKRSCSNARAPERPGTEPPRLAVYLWPPLTPTRTNPQASHDSGASRAPSFGKHPIS